jgi:hypothetical protein
MLKVFIEAFVVGIILAVLGLAVSTALMSMNPSFVWANYNHWTSVMLAFFISGFVFHLACEALGVNHWYCSYKMK